MSRRDHGQGVSISQLLTRLVRDPESLLEAMGALIRKGIPERPIWHDQMRRHCHGSRY